MGYRILSKDERYSLVVELFKEFNNGRRRKGGLTDARNRWKCNIKIVYRIRDRAKKLGDDTKKIMAAITAKHHLCGRRSPTDAQVEEIQARVGRLPLLMRASIRTLSYALKIPRSTLAVYIRRGYLRAHTIRLKPLLPPEQKIKRFQHALSFVQVKDESLVMSPMLDYVHVDEKWSELKRIKRRVYLAPCKPAPYDAVQSKSHNPKVMFLTAVARSRHDYIRNQFFDGKLGIWSHIVKVPT